MGCKKCSPSLLLTWFYWGTIPLQPPNQKKTFLRPPLTLLKSAASRMNKSFLRSSSLAIFPIVKDFALLMSKKWKSQLSSGLSLYKPICISFNCWINAGLLRLETSIWVSSSMMRYPPSPFTNFFMKFKLIKCFLHQTKNLKLI